MSAINVENIVASFQLPQPATLDTLKKHFPGAKYKPEDAETLIVHFERPPAAAMLHPSGNIIITGPKTMDDTKQIQHQLLQKITPKQTTNPPELTIQNIVVSANLPHKINLKSLAKQLPKARYTADTFPGLSYQMTNPNTLILVFESGAIVCNGTSMEDIKKAVTTMEEKISSLKDK